MVIGWSESLFVSTNPIYDGIINFLVNLKLSVCGYMIPSFSVCDPGWLGSFRSDTQGIAGLLMLFRFLCLITFFSENLGTTKIYYFNEIKSFIFVNIIKYKYYRCCNSYPKFL